MPLSYYLTNAYCSCLTFDQFCSFSRFMVFSLKLLSVVQSPESGFLLLPGLVVHNPPSSMHVQGKVLLTHLSLLWTLNEHFFLRKIHLLGSPISTIPQLNDIEIISMKVFVSILWLKKQAGSYSHMLMLQEDCGVPQCLAKLEIQ